MRKASRQDGMFPNLPGGQSIVCTEEEGLLVNMQIQVGVTLKDEC